MAAMERVNRILRHPTFRRELESIRQAESHRVFCCHGMEHLLAVARLMALSHRDGIPQELCYAAALLHDLGRGAEYAAGTDHVQSSVALASALLPQCGFTPAETELVLTAIGEHRSSFSGQRTPLGALLYGADKESRPCFACPVSDQCNWSEEKKNHTLLR